MLTPSFPVMLVALMAEQSVVKFLEKIRVGGEPG
jgi:hypothetical protein